MQKLRPQALSDDLKPGILALNNAHATELSWLSAVQLDTLLQEAFYARQIDQGDAFLLAFDQHAAYASPNYLWFRERYPSFVYIDRVVVSPPKRGRGHARALYMDLFVQARRKGHSLVTCEVNSAPPNPASEAFHAAMGFGEVGHATLYQGSKTVRYLTRAV